MKRPLFACVAAVTFAMAQAAPAFAADNPSAEAPRIVHVFVAGPAEAVAGSREAVQDLCARSNVAVIVRDAAGADDELLAVSRERGLADAYVDLRTGTPRRVVVVDGATRRDLERRSLPEDASLELAIETMAQVVCSAVESSLAARAGDAEPPPAANPPPPPAVVAPRPKPSFGVESKVSVFGALSSLGSGAQGGIGAAVDVLFGERGPRPGLRLSLAGFAPSEIDRYGGEASFAAAGGRLLGTVEWPVTREFAPFAGVGAGADWIWLPDRQAPPGATASNSRAVAEPMAEALLGATLRLGRSAGVVAAAGIDVDLLRHSYVVQTPQGNAAFFEPSRVRPTALLGLSVSFGGPALDEPSPTEVRP